MHELYVVLKLKLGSDRDSDSDNIQTYDSKRGLAEELVRAIESDKYLSTTEMDYTADEDIPTLVEWHRYLTIDLPGCDYFAEIHVLSSETPIRVLSSETPIRIVEGFRKYIILCKNGYELEFYDSLADMAGAIANGAALWGMEPKENEQLKISLHGVSSVDGMVQVLRSVPGPHYYNYASIRVVESDTAIISTCAI